MDLNLRDRVYIVTGGARGLGFAAAEDRYGRLDGALVSVGGTPIGSVATTPDAAWRSAFEEVFLGAVRIARVLGDYLAEERGAGGASERVAGTSGSLVFVLASSVRVPAARNSQFQRAVFPGSPASSRCSPRNSAPPAHASTRSSPVRIATDRVRQLDALSGDPDAVRARKSQDIPLRRYGEPAEFGRMAAFLLSPGAPGRMSRQY